ncbi:hypothetical protein [Komagataeibacter diospyri]|uniref:hypothetical protein n=1 Tax=Komagataeibacter diospyri TaxID=1932662 RepID=UPI001143AE81|nr:hypothetical protein [Komagataeibacter diospyri]
MTGKTIYFPTVIHQPGASAPEHAVNKKLLHAPAACTDDEYSNKRTRQIKTDPFLIRRLPDGIENGSTPYIEKTFNCYALTILMHGIYSHDFVYFTPFLPLTQDLYMPE